MRRLAPSATPKPWHCLFRITVVIPGHFTASFSYIDPRQKICYYLWLFASAHAMRQPHDTHSCHEKWLKQYQGQGSGLVAKKSQMLARSK